MEDLGVNNVDLTISGVLKYLDEGNSVNSFNDRGVTLLHKAAIENLFDVVSCLLENGANPNLRTFRGDATPLDFARERADDNIISLLQNVTEISKFDSNVRRLKKIERLNTLNLKEDEIINSLKPSPFIDFCLFRNKIGRSTVHEI